MDPDLKALIDRHAEIFFEYLSSLLTVAREARDWLKEIDKSIGFIDLRCEK